MHKLITLSNFTFGCSHTSSLHASWKLWQGGLIGTHILLTLPKAQPGMSPEIIAGIAVGAMVLIVALFFIVFSCGVLVAGTWTCSLVHWMNVGYGIITFEHKSIFRPTSEV